MNNEIKILLIEDNSGDAKLVEIYLSDAQNIPFKLTHVTRLSDGLSLSQQGEQFAIVLLDLHLPDSSGFATLERALVAFPKNVSIVVLSGTDDEATGIEAVQAGAQDYLVKGQIDTAILTRTMLYSMQRRNMQLQVEHAAQELRLSEKRLLQAQHIAKIGNYELDIEDNEMYWSAEIYRILGFDPNDTQLTYDVFLSVVKNDNEKEDLKKIINGVFAGKHTNSFRLEYKIETPQKEIKYLRNQGQLDFDEISHKPKLVGTIQDITNSKIQQKKLTQSEERHRTIFEQSQDSIFISTIDGKLLEYNPSMVHLLGYNAEELESLIMPELYAKPQVYFDMVAAIEKENGIKDYDIQLKHKNNELIDALITANLWRSLEGEIKGFNAIIRDITPYKRTQELIKAKEIAERSALLKEQFLANMSHEIRTPMNVVVGMAHLLEGTNLNNQQKEYLSNLKVSSETLLKIINNILDFSKIESGKLTLEQHPFKIQELIAEVVQAYKFKAREKGISLFVQTDIDLPEIILGDSVRLLQILNNLVSNAVKYTHKGEIVLRTQVTNDENEYMTIKFAIKDTGIGIPIEKQKTVFDSFSQASANTTRLYGGTGLGLSIAKHLVELFGGQLNLISEPDKGSEFSFTIRFKKLIEDEYNNKNNQQSFNTYVPDDTVSVFIGEDVPAHAHTQTIDKEIKILLVEDHKLNQVVVKDIIKRWSPKIIIDIAENGKEAIERLEKQPNYDLILMDISMPVMDGYQATEYIRNQMPPPVKNLPIIAMTAHAFNTNAAKCFEIGMNEFVSKPINPSVMFAKINEILHRFGKLTDSPNVNVKPEPIQTQTASTQHLSNLDYLDELSGGDKDLKIMMLETVLQGLPDEIIAVEQALNNQNWSELRAAAHKMKSTCAYIGLNETVEIARSIENSAYEQKNSNLIPNWVKTLAQHCRTAHEELTLEFEKLKTTT